MYNFKQYFEKQIRAKQTLELGDVVKLTTQAAGMSEKTVQRIRTDEDANEGAFGSKKKKIHSNKEEN